ncbi:hypothetical protein GVN22_03600 [Cellulophaga sp. BC115SP]|nr:hypothetical protein [Cellulophaga sp. BC115SP]
MSYKGLAELSKKLENTNQTANFFGKYNHAARKELQWLISVRTDTGLLY